MCLFQLWFSEGYILSGGIVGSYDSFVPVFFFLRNLYSVFQSGYIIFQITTVQEGSLFSTSSPAFLFVDFLMMAILTGVR